MPIPLSCSCGGAYRVNDDLAGRKVRCRACGAILFVPRAAIPEVLPAGREDVPEVLPAGPPTAIQAEPPPTHPRRRRRRRTRADWRDGEEPPAGRRSGGLHIVFEEGWLGSVNAGVVGGLLSIALGIGVLFLGMAFGRLFLAAPVLIVLGVAAFVKGLLEAG